MSTESSKLIPHEDLVMMLQDGVIGFLQYVMNGEFATDFIEWCKATHTEPNDDIAELYCSLSEIDMIEHQYMDSDGIWL